jgi:hypothetical protein
MLTTSRRVESHETNAASPRWGGRAGRVRSAVARRILRLSGLPSLGPVRVDAATEATLNGIADRLEAGDAQAMNDAPVPRIEFLRWLAENRAVLFHGSGREDLAVLEPIRLSRDTTEFGDQQAVFATSDPVWAIYFAILRRDAPFGTRNGSLGIAGGSIYPRWYHFSVTRPLDQTTRFGPGSLYVVPRAQFTSEPPLHGVYETAQWVSPLPVRTLVRVDVTPDDFPFLNAVVSHRDRDPGLFVYARTVARQRSSRR